MTELYEARVSAEGSGLFALQDLEVRTRVIELQGELVPAADKYTLQIDADKHLYGSEGTKWRLLNHSCDPTGYIEQDTTTGAVYFTSIKPLKKGDQLTFNYLTTEWDMSEPFHCLCQQQCCYGDIRGFKHLSRDTQKQLQHVATPYIRKLAGLVVVAQDSS